MAAPAEKTLKDMNGTWLMNKKLSDDSDPLLTLQGIGWIMRKAISLGSLTLTIKEYVDDDGITHIDIEQTITGGLKGTTELRKLDWIEAEHVDHVFGKVLGKSRWIKMSDVNDEFLKRGWLPEMMDGDTIQSFATSVGNGWDAEQIWGFEEVGGIRRYVRHVVVKKKDQKKTAKLVYDFVK